MPLSEFDINVTKGIEGIAIAMLTMYFRFSGWRYTPDVLTN